MDDLRKAAKMALEALEWRFSNVPETIEALRQALAQPWDTTDMAYRPNGLSVEQSIAQPEQEPVAWMYVNEDGECEQIEYGVSTIEAPYIKLLYTAPPSKPEKEKESTPSNVDPRVLLISNGDFTKETENRLCDIERRLAVIETQPDEETSKKPHAVSYKDGVPVAYYNFDPPPYTAPPSKPWVGLDDKDFQYQVPHDVITMKYAEAILKEKNT